jgi:myosin-5
MLWLWKSGEWVVVDEEEAKTTNSTCETLAYYPYQNETNLSELIDLNEANCLEALRMRYQNNQIYTNSSDVLVAINPYCALPLYQIPDEPYQLPRQPPELHNKPHVYQFVEKCLYPLFSRGVDQNILVSGESGAGKTKTTSFITSYIEKRCGESANNLGGESITISAKKQSYYTDVLESFGNAKTRRNDNSSRFGKYLTLCFHQTDFIKTELDTYLLEKNRMIVPIEGEQSFHVVYQILAEDPDLLKHLQQHNCRFLSTNSFDVKQLTPQIHQAKKNMENLGFTCETISSYHNIVKGLLLLGCDNLESTSLVPFLENYLKIDYQKALAPKLKNNTRIIQGETILTPWTSQQKTLLIDSFVTSTYQALFQALVSQIRQVLGNSKQQEVTAKLGILDIFGFEVFQENGFDQLCINFANEKLQVQFNKQMIQNQQKEYQEEGIDWSHIDFRGNEECVYILEKHLFSYLDDITRLVSVHSHSDEMDARVISQFKKHITENPSPRPVAYFPKMDPPSDFTIRHFATEVEYQTKTLCYRNQDQVHSMIPEVLSTSSDPLLSSLTKYLSVQVGSQQKKSVSRRFRQNLDSLIYRLESGDIHYIRCLKPNDEAQPAQFNKSRVLEQLKYSGLIEANRVARLGYPVRWVFDDFLKRYRPLFPKKQINTYLAQQEGLVQGKTKYFMKQECYQNFENNLTTRRRQAVTMIQALYRRFIAWRDYQITKTRITMIQSAIRMKLAILQKTYLQHRLKGALKIQSRWRGYYQFYRYCRIIKAIYRIQRWTTAHLTRKSTLRQAIEKRQQRERYHRAMETVRKYISQKIKTKRDIFCRLAQIEQENQRLLHSRQTTTHQIETQKEIIEQKQVELNEILEEVTKQQEHIHHLESNREREKDCKLEMLKEIQSIVNENDAMRKELEAYRNYMTENNKGQCLIQ